ncbi:Zinc finger transcription factor YRR1 [Hypsizygus marmoreus]|uniref:Zinc finger transcription factor YRR1 n=1 Tax=Hypsizygus marmoreus TaxID=39966 RepID=A0A369K815_HYPMA|nr:Zinc finger transcription factor YRR1 [Hypsizygus marmoreus]
MPKTPSTSSTRPALRRNQACRSCRKRKLKCDAARPHCGTCVKQWQALVSVPAPVGYAHPTEPQCSYDPVEGLTLAPDTDPLEKIKQLEDQISRLKTRLYEQEASRSITPGRPPSQLYSDAMGPIASTSRQHADVGAISLPHASLSMMNIVGIDSPDTRFRSQSGSPESYTINGNKQAGPSLDPFMDLLFLGWNPDLPDPTTLNHYIDIFFKCDPCGSRVLHRTSFLASMHLPPRDPGFPHSAILHAICAAASRWSPQNVVTLPDGTRRDQFAEFHASKTRQYIDKTMASGEDIFSVMQACILLSWYFYQEGRWVEVWIFAGFQTRVAVPLRLNYPGTFSTHGNNSPGAYLAPPKDLRDLESRRRTWWMTILFDRIASVGGWIHAVDERDLGTELPLRNEDFESEVAIPSNPQDLASPDVFTRHPPQYTDSFLLLIKAVMLFGRVTDYNVRGNLRAPTAPSKNQNPFFLEGFSELDKLVSSDFLQSLPQIFKNNTGVTDAPDGSRLDTDLYMVHIIPHAATITLHNPYIDFTDPQCVSTARCVHSARSILSAYYVLSATSLDISRLHPFVTICWYLAAVVQVQLCKYFIEINDNERESTVWGEINVLRFAMMEYGHRSPIGTRQERLLQGLMREIVRMTAQKQPLEVGVPLYPFSHTSLFRKDESPRPPQSEDGAPLPNPVARSPPIPSGLHGRSMSGATNTWSMHDLSVSPQGGL